MATLTVEVNAKQLADVESLLSGIKNGAKRAIVRSANRVITRGQKQIAVAIGEEINLKQKTIRESLKIDRADFNDPVARLTISKKPVPLIDFGARKVNKGVTVKVHKSGGRDLLRGAFIATMKTGHRGVFERQNLPGRKRRGNWHPTKRIWKEKNGKRYKTELPIEERKGPTVLGLFQGLPSFAQKILSDIAADFAKELDSQVKLLLSQNPKA